MTVYKLGAGGGVIRTADGALIPDDPANRDWRGYQDWRAAGNVPTPAPQPPQPTYRDKRKAAYIAELGQKPDFVETVGDVLDDLIREIRARGATSTPEFSALTAKIDAIKARFPKV